MKIPFLFVIGSFVLLTSVPSCENKGPGSTAPPSAPVTQETAAQLFVQRCATCHGNAGNLGIGGAKKLTESTLSKEDIASQIRYGKGTMPPFKDLLNAQEIEAVALHTHSLQAAR